MMVIVVMVIVVLVLAFLGYVLVSGRFLGADRI